MGYIRLHLVDAHSKHACVPCRSLYRIRRNQSLQLSAILSQSYLGPIMSRTEIQNSSLPRPFAWTEQQGRVDDRRQYGRILMTHLLEFGKQIAVNRTNVPVQDKY